MSVKRRRQGLKRKKWRHTFEPAGGDRHTSSSSVSPWVGASDSRFRSG